MQISMRLAPLAHTASEQAAQDDAAAKPEVDDQVLVSFAHGELRAPFALGTLWNSDDAPEK